MVAAAFAGRVVAEPAVFRKSNFEDIFPGARMNRARTFKAIPIARNLESRNQSINFEYLMK